MTVLSRYHAQPCITVLRISDMSNNFFKTKGGVFSLPPPLGVSENATKDFPKDLFVDESFLYLYQTSIGNVLFERNTYGIPFALSINPGAK